MFEAPSPGLGTRGLRFAAWITPGSRKACFPGVWGGVRIPGEQRPGRGDGFSVRRIDDAAIGILGQEGEQPLLATTMLKVSHETARK